MGERRVRIYVGGLGPNVKEEDLKKTFGSLGTVQSVELNRNKGRSFGYMEFLPSSDKSLVKLFSSYNGCMWKGGKLKLEKAREHYLSRLKREWNEEAQLAAAKLAKQNLAKEAPVVRAPTKFGADQDMQIKVYFPKLRKIRPLPFKGTGKHKYSFQRVEVPPLPINFCDCEEHSAAASGYTKAFFRPVSTHFSRNTEELFRPPVVAARRKDTNDIEREAFMVTEQEVDIMKSVLNKLAEKENSSSKISNESKFTKKITHPATSGDNLQVDDSEEGQVSDHDDDDDDDDDDVVINVVGRSSNRVDPFEDWRPKASVNQDSLSTEMESVTGSQKMKLQHDKKRKAINHPVSSGDNLQADESEEGQVSDHDDDDDVVINVVGRSSNRVDPFEDWRPKATVNQDSLSEIESVTGRQMKLQHDKKRKAPASETETNDNRSPKRMTNNENLFPNSGPKATELCLEVAPVRKNAWKNLVAQEGSTSFHISDILPSLNAEESKLEYVAPENKELEILSDDQSKESTESESDSMESAENEIQPMESSESESEGEESAESESEAEDSAESESRVEEAAESENQAEEAAESVRQTKEPAESESQSKETGVGECQSKEAVESESPLAENERHDDQANENHELEMPSAANKPDKLNESDNKSARGAAWLHTKSWTQLVTDASSKSFSFSEILPTGTFEKQELTNCESNVFPDSKDENFLAGDTSIHSGGLEEALVEKQDDAGLNKDKITSEDDKKIEHNNRAFERKDVVISETCPFMRSAASRKDWAKAKAALSRSLKKKTKVKEMDSD